jgi:cell division protein FtsI/penicillin-binding protein 2
VLGPDGHVVKDHPPEVVRRVCSEEHAATVMQGLHRVVTHGTCIKQPPIPGYSWAGKTGTAQLWDSAIKDFSKDKFVCSFCGYAPAKDPAILAIVVVHEPDVAESRAFGSTMAAPLFRRLVARSLEYLQVPHDMPETVSPAPETFARRPQPPQVTTAEPLPQGQPVPTRGSPSPVR